MSPGAETSIGRRLVGAPETMSAAIIEGSAFVAFTGSELAPQPSADIDRETPHCFWRGADGLWSGLLFITEVPQVLRERNASAQSEDASALAALCDASAADGEALTAFCAAVARAGAGPAARRFAEELLATSAREDGFIEVLARPAAGGVFIQGWSRALSCERSDVASLRIACGERRAIVARFERPDLAAPAAGFCAYLSECDAEWIASPTPITFMSDGASHRLEPVPSGPVVIPPGVADTHIRELAASLIGHEEAIRAFREAATPPFDGTSTIEETAEPVAAALDALFAAPNGDLFAIGWIIDPDGLVESVRAPGGSRLDDGFTRLARPDLAEAFASDPRFAGRLHAARAAYGFASRIPAAAASGARSGFHLDFRLHCGERLYLAADPSPARSAAQAVPSFQHLPPGSLEFEDLARRHFVPFATGFAQNAAVRTAPEVTRLAPKIDARVSAVVPFRDERDLYPMFAALSDAPELSLLEFAFVAHRPVAERSHKMLRDAARFYGFSASLAVTDVEDGLGAQLDAGVSASDAPFVLVWSPCALPKRQGWLEPLLREAEEAHAVVSPTLIHEDGSICYACGQSEWDQAPRELAGYGEDRVSADASIAAPFCALELCCASRSLVVAAGGFSGRAVSETFAARDFSERVEAAGGRCRWTSSVGFWRLGGAESAESARRTQLMRRLDEEMFAVEERASRRAAA